MDEETNPIAYNLNIFEFLAHFALKNPEKPLLMKFALDSLDFLRIDEIS